VSSGQGGDEGPRTAGPRRIAEWVSFGISLALVAAVVSHLVARSLEPAPEAIQTHVRPLLDRVARQEGRFVVPFEVRNGSSRAVRDLQIRIRYEAEGRPESMDVLIDYLGQASVQIVYGYFREDPRSLSLTAESVAYRLD
jgi:uncharacterized protein (TIGR02588 family)